MTSTLPWVALTVNTRSESLAATALRNRGYEVFSPTFLERRRYSDRFKLVDSPVLSGYVLIRWDGGSKTPILSSPAVRRFVAFGKEPVAIPEHTINNIRRMLDTGGRPAAYFTAGDRVRVEAGVLAGIEGTYLRRSGGGQLIVSVDVIERSISVHIDEDQVHLLHPASSKAQQDNDKAN